MDGIHGLLKWVDHNRWLAVAMIVSCLICVGFLGCHPKTASVLDPGKQVTQDALQREAAVVESDYEAKLAAFEIAQADLDRQYALRQQIVGVVGALGTSAAGGGLTPAAGVAGAIQLLTLAAAGGAVVDNRRKDKLLKSKTKT